MGIFDRFPYSSTHEMNLDFMLGKATEIAESLQEIDTHKEQAEQAATNAAQSATNAAQAAQAAAGSQTAASASAAAADQHKTDAEDAADRAEAASDLADEAVEQAQTAAQNASTAADGAIASATAAETRINTLAASLPEDFTEVTDEITSLKSDFESVTEIINYLPSTQKNTTVVGLSVVYNDAVVTISGTSTGAGGRLIAISDSFILLPGTYTLSCDGLDNTIGVFLEEGSSIITSISPTTPISTFEVTTQKTAYIGINFSNNLTYNKTVKIQLQKGEEATSFIKPSQKTAIDFLSRDDITKIKRQQAEYNKNLFALDDATSGLYIAFGSGNAYAMDNSFASDYMPVSGGATLFIQNYTTQPSADARGLAFYDENKVFIANSGVQYTNQNTMEIPIPADAFYVRITVASALVNETIVNVLLNYDAIERIAEIQDRNILYAFSNITCFGDSLTYSQVYTSNNTSRQAYVPYPKVLEKMLGTPVEFYAQAGITTAGSWSAFKNDVVEKNNQLIIIYLGTNQGLTDTLATDAVGTDYNTYANTNTGCYAAYVAKAKAENAKVILIKVTGTSGESGVSDATVTNSVIDQVATRYGCAVIEPIALSDPKYHYYPDGSGLNSGHYNDFGYSAFACVLAKQIALLDDANFKAIMPT